MKKSLTKESLLKQLELDGREDLLCTQAVKELLEYKKIEEDRGIDLVTLSKAIKGIKRRSVYNVEKKSHVFVNTIIYYENDLIIKGYDEDSVFLVKEYGKTWALTEEELK